MMDFFQVNELIPNLIDYNKSGGRERFPLGWDSIKQHYSMVRGSCTDWSGWPSSGKTTFMLDCLVQSTQYHGWKHLMHCPDHGSVTELMADLLTRWTGKQVRKGYFKSGQFVNYKEVMTSDEIEHYTRELSKSFFIYKPKKNGRINQRVRPEDFWEGAIDFKKEHGIDTAVIDSWNHMNHDISKFPREDKWLEYVLSLRNELAEEYDLHFHTVIHPRNADSGDYDKKTGELKAPNKHKFKGGSEFANNMKSGIIVHRSTSTSPNTTIIFDKCKPKEVGVPGKINMYLDLSNFTFFEYYGDVKAYPTNPNKVGQQDLRYEPQEPTIESDPSLGLPEPKNLPF